MRKNVIGNGLRRGIVIFISVTLFFLNTSIYVQIIQIQEGQFQVAQDLEEQIPGPQAEEEQLILLMPTPSKYLDPYIDKFKDWYFNQTSKNITVEHVRKGGVECVSYIEGQAKQPDEDIIASIGYKEIEYLRIGGYLQPYVSSNAAYIPETVLGSLVGKNLDGYYTGFSLSAYGIMVNTDVLQSKGLANVTGYTDLAFNTSYYGHIVMGSPILSRISHGNMEVMLSHFAWVQGWNASIHLASLVGEFTTTTGNANNLTAEGEYAAVLTKYSYWYEYNAKNCSVEWIWPVEGTYIYNLYTGILNGTKNEENAKLWVDWMLSEEGQRAWVECRSETVLRSDINLPEDMPTVEELAVIAKIAPNYDEDIMMARYDSVTNLWLKLIGYHSNLQKNYDNSEVLDTYLNEWIIEPLLKAEDGIANAQDAVAIAITMDLTNIGQYFLERAENLLFEAQVMYNLTCDYDEAYILAKEAEHSAETAIAYIVQPPPPPIWPYYLTIGIITIVLLGVYLKRKQLKHYSQKLEIKVTERTKEIQQANIHLKSLDQLKSMFLASMSHELRTPLNSVLGFTGWLLMGMEGDLNEEQKKQLTMVKSSANLLLDLINNILDISRIEAGQVELGIEKFEIVEVIKSVVNSVLPIANDKGLKLICNLPKRMILYSDKRRIRQILMNLARNAIKFTDQGNVKIDVKTINNNDLEFIVSDSGIGIKKEDMEKLFQPFQQIDMSSTKRHKGTGLGLYLCKKLIDLLHGEISVTSQFGKGSEFKFIIPIEFKEEV